LESIIFSQSTLLTIMCQALTVYSYRPSVAYKVRHAYIPVQFIKSFCCIEAEKRVKKKLQGRLILTQGGRRGYSKISFVHRFGLFFSGVQILNCYYRPSMLNKVRHAGASVSLLGTLCFYFLSKIFHLN
jgi:hypothetical protein